MHFWLGIPHDFQLDLHEDCIWKQCRVLHRDLGDYFGGFFMFCFAWLSKRELRSLWRTVSLQGFCTFKCCIFFYFILCMCSLFQPLLLNSSVNSVLHPLLAFVTPSCYRILEHVKLRTNNKGQILWIPLWKHFR